MLGFGASAVLRRPFKSGVSGSYSTPAFPQLNPDDFQRQTLWGLFSLVWNPRAWNPWTPCSSGRTSASLIFLPLVGHCTGVLVPDQTASLSLLLFSMWLFCCCCLLWKNCSANLQVILRASYSVYSCSLGACRGGDELQIFLLHHLPRASSLSRYYILFFPTEIPTTRILGFFIVSCLSCSIFHPFSSWSFSLCLCTDLVF